MTCLGLESTRDILGSLCTRHIKVFPIQHQGLQLSLDLFRRQKVKVLFNTNLGILLSSGLVLTGTVPELNRGLA
jgi:hypothetical protein